ncbi:MAG: hypothetical protein IJG25_05120, partial [Thermoguttaceae bacterium]|nr:hypothetical protein [Thermoguttaceae bacterium]
LEITLREGKNREIRRMLARVGHKVLHLKRVAVGPVKLGKLLAGDYRPLTNEEISRLYSAAGRPNRPKTAASRAAKSKPSERESAAKPAGRKPPRRRGE